MPRAQNPDPVDIDVGRRIRVRRSQLGFSQTYLGEKLGVTFQQVQKYEKGANRVAAGRLVKIAEVLGTSVQSLTNCEGQGDRSASELLVQPYVLDLLKHFTKLENHKVRSALVKLVEQIASEGRPKI